MTTKICPLNRSECLTEKCACYIKIVKPSWISRSRGIIDPEQYYRYEGCGLVKAIPWRLINRNSMKVCAKLENIEK